MKKFALTLTLALALILSLAACGGNPAPTDTPVPPTPSPAPSEPAAEETVYTTVINEADVTFTVSADQKSIAVDTMGMTVKGACEVADNVLTFGEQTEGNDQIWASLSKNQYTLNADGTATAIEGAPEQSGEPEQSADPAQGDDPSYPENSLVLDFTPDINEQLRKTFYVESGTWGTAFGGQGDYTPTDSADELFAWTTGKEGSSFLLTFFADGTYKFEFTDMKVEETGTWTWSGWKLTVTTAGGTSFTGSINK